MRAVRGAELACVALVCLGCSGPISKGLVSVYCDVFTSDLPEIFVEDEIVAEKISYAGAEHLFAKLKTLFGFL
jgi:hypothetical protein